jgi:hypothetical protein
VLDVSIANSQMSNTIKEGVAILVVSCDAYKDLWHPFFHCFFKYWPDCPYPVFLGSNFVSYQDDRVKAVLVGRDVDYSSNLFKMLENIEHEYIILWIEDRILSKPVDTSRIQNLVNLAKNQNVGYLRLIALWPFAVPRDKLQEFGEISKGHKYRISITVALWKKSVLLKLLRPGETAWDLERQGSKRSNDFDEKFFSLSFSIIDSPPFSDQHLIMKGKLVRNTTDFLRREKLGTELSLRQIQTFWSYLYYRAYSNFVNFATYLRWRWVSFRGAGFFDRR